MKRNFNEWLKTFKSSICDYGYYVDFEKVYGNIENIKVELNILNSLIGSKNIVVVKFMLSTETANIFLTLTNLTTPRKNT